MAMSWDIPFCIFNIIWLLRLSSSSIVVALVSCSSVLGAYISYWFLLNLNFSNLRNFCTGLSLLFAFKVLWRPWIAWGFSWQSRVASHPWSSIIVRVDVHKRLPEISIILCHLRSISVTRSFLPKWLCNRLLHWGPVLSTHSPIVATGYSISILTISHWCVSLRSRKWRSSWNLIMIHILMSLLVDKRAKVIWRVWFGNLIANMVNLSLVVLKVHSGLFQL